MGIAPEYQRFLNAIYWPAQSAPLGVGNVLWSQSHMWSSSNGRKMTKFCTGPRPSQDLLCSACLLITTLPLSTSGPARGGCSVHENAWYEDGTRSGVDTLLIPAWHPVVESHFSGILSRQHGSNSFHTHSWREKYLDILSASFESGHRPRLPKKISHSSQYQCQ